MGNSFAGLPEHLKARVSEAYAQDADSRRRRNKYNVAPKEKRTHEGRVYASKAEMLYAQKLAFDRAIGVVRLFIEQPKTTLGVPENVYRPDFLVVPMIGPPYFVDVKGRETPSFRRNKKLWAAYGTAPLHVVRLKGKSWQTVEVIEPRSDK